MMVTNKQTKHDENVTYEYACNCTRDTRSAMRN